MLPRMPIGQKRQKKPPRPNNRDELIAPAPSSAIGSYAYFHQGPFNVRDTQIRDANKQFGHHDFRYNLQTANNDLVHHLHPQYSFGKHPSQNELHGSHFTQFFNQGEDFTRNLVPPPAVKPKEVNEKKVLLSNPSGFILPQQKPFQDVIPIHNYGFGESDLEITKENIREYHTTVAPLVYTKATEYTTKFTKPKSTFGYEVTEEKHWQENTPYFRLFGSGTTPFKPVTYPTAIPEVVPNLETTMFLPTPFKPEPSFPTSPTQSEVSTIYSQLSKRPYHDQKYNIKEVATHFPIFEPQPIPTHVLVPVNKHSETTTVRYEPEEATQVFVQPTQETTTKFPSRNRLSQRRRRPTRPPVVDEDVPKRRRPSKYHQEVMDHVPEPTRATIRRKPARPTTEEAIISENYPPSFRPQDFRKPQVEDSGEMFTEVYDAQKTEEHFEEATTLRSTTRITTRYYEPEVETTTIAKRKRTRPTTEATTIHTENELDYTTIPPPTEEPVREVQTYRPEPEATTVPTTTTTTEATTKANRLRRPIKYDSHRPRFSVKDYRQRLSQYTSTTTEQTRVTNDAPGRIKYPSRFTKSDERDESSTESMRQKFKPKDPRHRFSTEATPEAPTRSTRRPFSRIRTTEPSVSTTHAKISIKPNIFSNLKRPAPISLRNRINKTKNVTTTTESAEPTDNDVMEDEISTERVEPETTTETYRRSSENFEKDEIEEINDDAEAFLQLQRISELTSSAKNNPSYFKTMSSSTSRRVPSYFKIATDDPILPIEAFFPNLKTT